MDDCIATIERKLRLTDKEAHGVVISKEDTSVAIHDGNLCLVGKIFANRFFGCDMVFEAMKKVWKLKGNLDFKAVGEDIFFIQFSNRLDLLKVKCGGPWHFDQNILVREHFNGNLTPKEYKFNSTRVWMHVMDSPLKCLTMACAKQFGNVVGKFVEWDKGDSKIVWCRKMSIRVKLFLDQPLMRGTKLYLGLNDG